MNLQQNPPQGDWRSGYRTAFERVPRPPRTPGPIVKELIYGYQGGQGALRLIGAIFMAIGLPLALFLGGGTTTDLALGISGQSTVATVTSTRVVTSVEINGAHPIGIKYHYTIDGEEYDAESFTTNSSVVTTALAGTSIPIEFLSAAPGWSRAKGTTSSMMGLAFLFVLIFPAAGAGMLFSAVRSNRREIRAFRDGVAAKGLVTKRAYDTSTEVNGKNPFEVHWEFQVDGMTYKGKLSNMDRYKLESVFPEDEVTVLYDPRDPKVNTVWLE